jgi:hypothetical protein
MDRGKLDLAKHPILVSMVSLQTFMSGVLTGIRELTIVTHRGETHRARRLVFDVALEVDRGATP